MQPRTPSHTSDFETIIENLFGKSDEPGQAPRPSHRFSLNSLEAAWGVAAHSRGEPETQTSAKPSRSYEDGYAPKENGISLDPERILSELGLHGGASEADIPSLRREFALRNHPDRVPPELKDLATKRMMIANDLFDRYVARLKKANR